jgi:hypothetical protein
MKTIFLNLRLCLLLTADNDATADNGALARYYKTIDLYKDTFSIFDRYKS